MNNSPLNKENLSKASILGVGLGTSAILLFIVLWFILGSLGVEQIPRILIALCLPPAIIAGAIGAYILLARPPR